jgi:hypothetical protein
MFEYLTKSNIAIFAGLALASLALPELLPNLRPTVRSAIKIGIGLLTESEVEAEAELVEALVAATMDGIRQDLSKPTTGTERSEAVQNRVEHFKHQAHIRARRWARDPEDHHRRYRRHVARLESSLAKQKHQIAKQDQQILDYTLAALGSEA